MRELCLKITADSLFLPSVTQQRGQDSSALGVANHGAISASGREHQSLLFLSSLPSPSHPCRQHWMNQDSLEVLEHWTTEDPHLLLGSCLSVGWHCIFREQWPVSHLQLWLYPGVLKFHFISPKGIHWDFLSLRSIVLVAMIEQFDVQQADIVEWQPSCTNWEVPMGGSHIGSLGEVTCGGA